MDERMNEESIIGNLWSDHVVFVIAVVLVAIATAGFQRWGTRNPELLLDFSFIKIL
jgi:hypothetical protein